LIGPDIIDELPFWIRVIVELRLHPQKDQAGTGDADSQAEYVEKTIGLVLPDVAQGCKQVVPEHGCDFEQKGPR
jgi:hypothetical protein